MSIISSSSSSLARIRIVAINDVYELANLPRVQTFLSKLSVPPVAVIVAGDFLSPSTLSSVDNGRGMVATLRAMGLTHATLGNHEQDLRLDSLHQRFVELSKSVQVVNSNLRDEQNMPSNASWFNSVTHPYSIIQSPCQKVSVAMLGLLSDEPGVFRGNKFKGTIPIRNILETYEDYYNQLVVGNNNNNNNNNTANAKAHFCLPVTHSSIVRDKELATKMLSLHGGKSLIIGGHEHEPYDEIVKNNDANDHSFVRILKTGMDANAASLIDLSFEVGDEQEPPILAEIESDLVDMSGFEPSVVVKKIVDKHMSVVEAFELEDVIDVDSMGLLPPGVLLSSERPRHEQTTVGGVFCQMIKDALECDAAIINGATIKGGKSYENGKITYAELKKELPFPTKMVAIPMQRYELQEAIDYSRTVVEDGSETNSNNNTTDDDDDGGGGAPPRRGYLQVDLDYDRAGMLGSPDEELKVALPRNLLNGFCKNKILMETGVRLKEQNLFPGEDDYIPAIDLVVRHACKNRWLQIVDDMSSFDDYDLNKDGVLDRYEIKQMMEQFLGHEPADFVVDDMLQSIDTDENGFIDAGEFSYLLAKMEREYSGSRF